MRYSMRTQRALRIGLGTVVFGFIVFVLISFISRSGRREPVNLAVEAQNTQYFAYDESGQQSVQLRCRESRWDKDGKLRLSQVEGSFARHGRMNRNVRFRSDSGLVGNDFNYFRIEGKSRVWADDLELTAEHFFMEEKKNLFVREGAVEISGRGLKGKARKGLEFFLSQNIYKLLDAQGEMIRDGRRYAFDCDEFWMFKDKNMMQLIGHARLQTPQSLLEGDNVIMEFSSEYETLNSYASHGNAVMSWYEKGSQRTRQVDIRAQAILCFNLNGCLQKLSVVQSAAIHIADPRQQLTVSGEGIEVTLAGNSQRIDRLTSPADSRIDVGGKRSYSLFGLNLDVTFAPDGALKGMVLDEGRVHVGRYHGETPHLVLDAGTQMISMQGDPSSIGWDANRFVAPDFQLDIDRQSIKTDSPLRATVVPQNRNALLEKEPMFLTADRLQVGPDGDPVGFSGHVKLFQGGTELSCLRLDLSQASHLISATGEVQLGFRQDNQEFRLGGRSVAFPETENRVMVTGAVNLQQTDRQLQADRLELAFEADRRLSVVQANDNVRFTQDKLDGQCQELEWRFREDLVYFRKNAQISRQGGGVSRGRELRLNLKTNDVLVRDVNKRTETVIQG